MICQRQKRVNLLVRLTARLAAAALIFPLLPAERIAFAQAPTPVDAAAAGSVIDNDGNGSGDFAPTQELMSAAVGIGINTIAIEPDSFTAGTVLNTIEDGVTLSSVRGSPTASGDVTSKVASWGAASTGTQVFGGAFAASGDQFGDGTWDYMLIDVSGLSSFISLSLDFVGTDALDANPVLAAYDAAGNLVDSDTAAGNFSSGQFANLSVSGAGITRVAALGDPGGLNINTFAGINNQPSGGAHSWGLDNLTITVGDAQLAAAVRRAHIEFDLSAVTIDPSELVSATVVLTTEKGANDSEDTEFFVGTVGNGTLEQGDFEEPDLDGPVVFLPVPDAPAGTGGTFSFGVTELVKNVLADPGNDFLSVQGRLGDETGPGPLEGLQIFTSASADPPVLQLETVDSPLVFSITALPAFGTLTNSAGAPIVGPLPVVLPDNQVNYLPPVGVTGTTSFAFQVFDNSTGTFDTSITTIVVQDTFFGDCLTSVLSCTFGRGS